ncbi:MAG: family 10 glycosylhydrolase [Pontiella sp.]
MKRFRILFPILIAVTALVAVLFVSMKPTGPTYPLVQALWVTRFDYSTALDVEQIIENVGQAGFTDVFFQVRGNGTAYYESKLEPWAHELSGNQLPMLGTNPGWDPLQLALDTARPYGLRVHAYINVLPGWKGRIDPPVQAKQLWTAHPDWFMVDSLGDKMLPSSGWYSFINPVIPAVRAHLRGIVEELCAYDVAGIHLDYIRYPYDYQIIADQLYPTATPEELARRSEFSYDAVSQSALYHKYGWEVTKSQIEEFRRDSITRVVQDISYAMQSKKPGRCLLSACVMGNPIEGRAHAYQDSGLWVRKGLVDWAVQMNYATKSFDRYLKNMKKAAGRKPFKKAVIVGIFCKHDPELILKQIDTVNTSGSRGLALFSYEYLFGTNHQVTEKGRIVLTKIGPISHVQ